MPMNYSGACSRDFRERLKTLKACYDILLPHRSGQNLHSPSKVRVFKNAKLFAFLKYPSNLSVCEKNFHEQYSAHRNYFAEEVRFELTIPFRI